MKSALFRFLIDAIVFIAGFSPVKKNRVVFCSYGGRGIGSDPGAIARELLRRCHGLEIVWMLKDLSTVIPAGIRKCRIYDQSKSIVGQLGALYKSARMFSSAKVIVCDSKGNFFKKNRMSTYIQTWHGDLPFKYIEGECAESLGKDHVRISSRDSKQTDIILSASSFMSGIFRKYFWLPCNCKVWEVGIPRNDIYFSRSSQDVKVFREYFGIADEIKLAAYAPTFRDNGDTKVYNSLDVRNIVSALSKKFGGKWKLLVRMHPNVNLSDCQIPFDDDVIDANKYSEGEVVFKASDILITDASSVIREFITMRKPIFVYFPDFVSYVHNCRSLRPLFFSLPFKRCGTNAELASEIESFNGEMYHRAVDEFLKVNDIRFFDNGNATKVVADYVDRVIRS